MPILRNRFGFLTWGILSFTAIKRVLFFYTFFTFFSLAFAQKKVALVLSGGGAKGIAHIGVLKYLEENRIPIHYVTGTSMGGLVGGFYACGYSPAQMEQIALSADFQNWVNGKIEEKYHNYYLRKEENASLISLSFKLDTTLKTSINPILVNDAPLNLAISKYTARSSVKTSNFDSLMVPFRCIAADVFSQSKLVLRKGNLSEALRATMSVPLIFKPFKLDGKYMYDGGIYNNFPVDVANDEFHPDFLIGVNVSSKTFTDYPFESDESHISHSLLYMLFAKSDSTLLKDKGVYIHPNMNELSTIDFEEVKLIIQAGYNEAKKRMEPYLDDLRDSLGFENLIQRRQIFASLPEPTTISKLHILGLRKSYKTFVFNTLRERKKELTIDKFSRRYYRIIQDGNFNLLFPLIKWNDSTQKYDLYAKMERERKLDLELGGNIATRAIQQLYLGYSYSFFNRLSFQAYGNFYTGRFYHSVQAKLRVIFPTVKQPFYFEPEITWNNWDYIRMNEIIFNENIPSYIRQYDLKTGITVGMPWKSRTRITAHKVYFNNSDRYLNDFRLNNKDTLDITVHEGLSSGISLDNYDLDKKMYPTKGTAFSLGVKYFYDEESHQPGSSSLLNERSFTAHNWLKLKFKYEQYLPVGKKYSLGCLAEGVFSSQPVFRNYTSTLIAAPAFSPMQDSKTLFLENYRGFYYLAGGMKHVLKFNSRLQFRAEAFFFQRFNDLEPMPNQEVRSVLRQAPIRFCGNVNLVYFTPFGPLSISGLYYDDPRRSYGVLLHIGYILFNNRSWD